MKHFKVSKVYTHMSSKNKICTAALELFMKYGVKSVSMDDIASRLGMSKKTVYSSIENKDELLEDAISEHMAVNQSIIKDIPGNSVDAIQEMVDITNYLTSFLSNMSPAFIFDIKKYYFPIFSKTKQIQINFTSNIVKQNLIRGQKEGLYRKDFDIDIMVKLYVILTSNIFEYLTETENTVDKINILNQMFSYHLYGITTEKGRNRLTQLTTVNQN